MRLIDLEISPLEPTRIVGPGLGRPAVKDRLGVGDVLILAQKSEGALDVGYVLRAAREGGVNDGGGWPRRWVANA